jgi:hypothetical protein
MRKYTDREIATVITMAKNGYRYEAIAEHINRSLGSILNLIYRMRAQGEAIPYRRNLKRFGQQKSTTLGKRAAEKLGVKLGYVSAAINAENIGDDVRFWILNETSKNKFDTVADFLIDMAVDVYFLEQEEKGKKQ